MSDSTSRHVCPACVRLREALARYGEHKWKCAISRRIRDGEAPGGTTCNCGWDLTRAAIAAIDCSGSS